MAKTGSKALDLTGDAGEFIGKIVGPTADAVGGAIGILSDQVGFYRAMRLNRLAELYWADVKRRGLNPDLLRALPFGAAIRVLEAASLEDDDDVQALWARLMASASDPERSVEVKKAYVDILRSLGAVEVAILHVMWIVKNISGLDAIDEFRKLTNEHLEATTYQSRSTALQNLMRLRCVAYVPRQRFTWDVLDLVRVHADRVRSL